MATRTYATLFDKDIVDAHMKELHSKLESSYLERKPYMSSANQRACEARLSVLRGTWILLLDKADD
jgi:hypothetical protein